MKILFEIVEKETAINLLKVDLAILKRHNLKINWNFLSSFEKLDWIWDFFELHFDNCKVFRLSVNEGIYSKLIGSSSLNSW